MRDYGKVYTKFWESEDIRALSDEGRLLALYLMTCPHGTIAGVFRLPDGYVCEDMKWTVEQVTSALSELLSKGFANRCETTKWVWVRKHLEWNPPENPNQRKSAVKIALSVPTECAWKQEFMRVCGPSVGIEQPEPAKGLPTVGEPFPNQEQKQEQEQKQDQKEDTPRKRGAKFVPDDFVVTDEMIQWAGMDAPLADWQRETAAFRDWEFSKPRTDWAKTWRTWMRKAHDDAKAKGATRRPVGPQSFAASDREAGMARWEQMTGRVHPDRATDANTVNEPLTAIGAPA